MSLPRYPEYRDSGVDWLGKVPSQWDVLPLKRHFRLITDRATTKRRAVALENIEGWSGRYIETEGEFQGDGTSFEPNDLLFGKLRPYLAKVLLADFPGEAVGDFHVLRPSRNLCPRFAQYQMLQREFISVVDGSTFGSKMPRAGWEALGGMPFVVPAVSEQEQIAAFLDRETARIDTLIAEQETLLALLAEKRQATISHAVTRGLDPNVPMKDSGIAWLGEVPAHWNVVLLRRIVSAVETGTTPISGPSVEAVESGTGWFTPGDFTALDLTASTKFVAKEHVAGGEVRCFPEGAILVVGIGATLGKVGILNAPASANQQVNAILIGAGHSARFFAYSLSAKAEIMKFLSNSSTIGILNQAKTKEIPIAVPPFDEQRRVVDELDFEVRKFDAISAEAELAKTLLRERRSALISAAVTGQIDVRGLVSGAAA